MRPGNEVTLTFLLNEDVSPALFASRVALACGRGNALRSGEGVEIPGTDKYLLVSGNAGLGDETVGVFS